ncbi:hypothetical protein [Micromonospora sp. NPDC005652]
MSTQFVAAGTAPRYDPITVQDHITAKLNGSRASAGQQRDK